MPASRDHVGLTIYNHGTSLVRERRTFDLQQGLNALDVTDVAAMIDPTSVTFQTAAGVEVMEQNYLYDLVGGEALLQRFLDERIAITADDGNLFEGRLLSARHQDLILGLDNGEIVYAKFDKVRDIRFPSLPDGLRTRPTLRWLLRSNVAGAQAFELTYLTGGLNWDADYNLVLATSNRVFDINGWVTLNNHSGTGFEDARVKLVAGDVARLPEQRDAPQMFKAAIREEAVQQRELFEYQLYEIARPVTVSQNETKQVEFVTATGVPCQTFYTFDAVGDAFSGYHGVMAEQHYWLQNASVLAWLEFTTGAQGGLGRDLPAGRLRAYQEDTDGAAVLIGESHIGHTPEGETVQLKLGAAFNLVGERTQTAFQQRGKTSIQESYEIKLRNRKDVEAVEIRVVEHLFRWSNWEIVESTEPFTRKDASTIEFRVEVSPGAEAVMSYTVRYTWPA